MDWLSKLDPNTVIIALSSLATLGGWLYKKAKGESTQSASSLIDDMMRSWGSELLDQYLPSEDVAMYLKKARLYIEKRWADTARKRGLNPSAPVIQKLYHESIERITAWLGNEIAAKRMPYQLDEAIAKLKAASAKLREEIAKP